MFDVTNFPMYLLVFVRVAAFIMTAPVFISKAIPNNVKIGLSVFLTLIAVPFSRDVATPIDVAGDFPLFLFKELLVGIALGLVASLILYAIELAGSFIDIMIGFAMASLFDPQMGINSALTGRFKYMLALLYLFSIDGHHLLIRGILTSFEWIHVNEWAPAFTDGSVSTYLLENLQQMFVSGLLIAAPIACTIFLVDVSLGIIAKTVPQMNVFVLGMPLKILIYFLIIMMVFPMFLDFLNGLFYSMFNAMENMMKIMGG